MKKTIFKASMAFVIIFAFSLFGFSAAFGYGGGGHGKPPVPTNVTAVNHPMTLTNAQSGVATNNFGQQATVALSVPMGAVPADEKITFKIQMSSANANIRPDTSGGAFMIGNKVFYITATDIGNKSYTDDFISPLGITMTLPEMSGVSDLDVYFINNDNEWESVSASVLGNTATFSVSHLTTFSVISYDGSGNIAIVKAPKKNVKAENSNKPGVTVLGISHYADGSLIRGENKKIYVIVDGVKQHIKNMKELMQYAGQPIFEVDDEVLGQYSGVEVLGISGYGNGALIRCNDMKIYVIVNGKCKHIANLKQLAKYAGQEIFNVTDDVVSSFEIVE
ncbi:hypothetical protein KAU09_04500 [Candidatus Parcubacteria bacterium]|nr:hypothetical protein [Candidatus Parcubacteria bacterium]